MRDLIEYRLIDNKVSKTILGEDGMGALGTFSSRIDMALALGAIEACEHRALKRLKGIRNDSAHQVAFSLSLQDNTANIDNIFTDIGFNYAEFVPYSPKVRFRAVAINLIARLAARPKDQQIEKLKLYDFGLYNNPNSTSLPSVSIPTL